METVLAAYDNVGNKVSQTENAGSPTTFGYDAAYRLIAQHATNGRATFVYDPAGNILVKAQHGSAPMTIAYDVANRPVTMLQGAVLTTFTSDQNGSLVGQNAGGSLSTFQYDKEQRLVQVNAAGSLSTYTYSGDGLRRTVWEPIASLTTEVWDGSDYLAEYVADAQDALYTVVEGEVLAELRAGTRRLYIPDPLGSTMALVNASFSKTDTWNYWPYGEVRTRTGATPTPLQYVGTAGYYFDLPGLTYVRARVLDPVLGRWMTRDPIATGLGDEHAYSYARTGPASFRDRSGLSVVSGVESFFRISQVLKGTSKPHKPDKGYCAAMFADCGALATNAYLSCTGAEGTVGGVFGCMIGIVVGAPGGPETSVPCGGFGLAIGTCVGAGAGALACWEDVYIPLHQHCVDDYKRCLKTGTWGHGAPHYE